MAIRHAAESFVMTRIFLNVFNMVMVMVEDLNEVDSMCL